MTRNRRWSATTKRTVVVILFVLLALVVYNFRVIIPPLVIAFLLAFILDPVVDFMTQRLHLPRGMATALVFLILIVGMVGVMAVPLPFIPDIQKALTALPDTITNIVNTISESLTEPIVVLGYPLDLTPFYEDLNRTLRSFASSVAEGTVSVAFGVASGAFWMIFILMAAFYMVKDADRLIEQIDNLPPAAYRDDFVRLRNEITDVWNAFLRGFLLLGLAMTVITSLVCISIGFPFPVAIALGVLAGLMEFVPSIGPFIAGIPAVLLAWFWDISFRGLSGIWLAVLVAGLYVVIQQIEGNILLPRILGRSLNLHPLLVLIAIVVGGSLAGILGMLLAAPVLATIRILAHYILCRLYDRDPFAKPEKKEEAPRPGLLKRAWEVVWRWLQEMMEEINEAEADADSPDTNER